MEQLTAPGTVYSYCNSGFSLLGRVIEASQAFPTTVFYDARGHLTFVHLGAYPSQPKLREDIRRYAGI